jgi:hypothetical protein
LADLTARDLSPDYVAADLSQAVEWTIAHAMGKPVADVRR